MPGRHVLNTALVSEFDEAAQFDPFVAAHAGIRRRPEGIALEEIIDDRFPEQPALIDDLVGNLQPLRHKLGNADLAAAAFLPLFRGGNMIVFMFPDLKSHAADIIAFADQESGGHRAVDTAAHSEQDRGLVHGPVLYWPGAETARGHVARRARTR